MSKFPHADVPDSDWKSLYRIGGFSALIAGLLFRRNLGVEIELFNRQKFPATVNDWFALLQNNRLIGLVYLHIFDLVNYTLVGLMFLAIYIALRRFRPALMIVAVVLGFLGIAVYFASNTALSMLSLSGQYAAAATEAERTGLLSAGQALLALNRFGGPGSQPGSGGFLSLLFIAAAGLVISVVMLHSGVFRRAAAYTGILASGLDLAYCLAFVFVPALDSGLLALVFISAAGLFWMIWHLLTGWRLYQLGKETASIGYQ